MVTPLSILDTTITTPGMSVADSLAASVDLAQAADASGYSRIWYTEHHNQAGVASAATAVVMGHVASKTNRIRVGSGGIMLPNHSPLVIAEQFGTLASLFPDRIDLGVGRASGSDTATMRALRRDPSAAGRFPDDVVELTGLLSSQSPVPGVKAIPGRGTNVPIFILGSSTNGAALAAKLGLPFVFAAHFSPDALDEATSMYRARFEPSSRLGEPHLIVSANVLAAETEDAAAAQYQGMLRSEGRKAAAHMGADHFSDNQMDELLDSGLGDQLAHIFHNTARGVPGHVVQSLFTLVQRVEADELLLVPQAVEPAARISSIELLAAEW